MKKFYSSEGLNDSFRKEFNIYDSSSYALLEKRNKTTFKAANIEQCLYRPFDILWQYYEVGITSRPAWDVMNHFLKRSNLALITMRQYEYNVPSYCYSYVSNLLTECRIFISNRGMATICPLYLYPTDKQQNNFDYDNWPRGEKDRIPNFDKAFVDELATKVKFDFVSDGTGDLTKTFGPEDIFHYIYAVLHSPEYRKRYAEFLKIDFPRIPTPSNKALFKKLCKVGSELTGLHLMESDILEDEKNWPAFGIEGSCLVDSGYPKYIAHADNPQKGKVYINKDQYFEGVSPDVWEFHIGGYQVCEKWLKDRRQRNLSVDDIRHYEKITVALKETMKLMNQIDEIINSHGGWPIK